MANTDDNQEATENNGNLISLADRTPEERAEIARLGGIASGEAKREKKRWSQLYTEILQEEYDKDGCGTLKNIVKAIMIGGGAPSVSIIKEMREATEGQKHVMSNDPENPLFMDEAAKAVLAKHKL
jgi:hypothetical protein